MLLVSQIDREEVLSIRGRERPQRVSHRTKYKTGLVPHGFRSRLHDMRQPQHPCVISPINGHKDALSATTRQKVTHLDFSLELLIGLIAAPGLNSGPDLESLVSACLVCLALHILVRWTPLRSQPVLAQVYRAVTGWICNFVSV